MRKPIIGITPLFDREKDSYWMLPGYLEGLEQAGAIPVILPLVEGKEDLAQLTQLCEGILFTGGQDVSPKLYGEAAKPTCGEVCAARDAMEQVLLQLALEQDLPVLGICRGIQFLNAALGGTLYQDLPTEHPSHIQHHMTPPYDRAVHTVTILPDTPLAEVLGATCIGVNSYHHQAVKTLAPGLTEMARSEDGLVEAVCLPDRRFVWAVQWHPEFSFRVDEYSRNIFAAFVQATGRA